MRLLNNCGCESREEIIFNAGKFGLPEGMILAGAVALVLIAWGVNR